MFQRLQDVAGPDFRVRWRMDLLARRVRRSALCLSSYQEACMGEVAERRY
jgi:hypothetical protein